VALADIHPAGGGEINAGGRKPASSPDLVHACYRIGLRLCASLGRNYDGMGLLSQSQMVDIAIKR
jgi:hypothetical protein